MRNKLFKNNVLIYELKNVIGNPFNICFGIFFPIMMALIMKVGVLSNIPASSYQQVSQSFFAGYLILGPLSIAFIGYSALFSQELQNNIVLRFSLFGYTNTQIMVGKYLSNTIVSLVAMFIYTIVIGPILKIDVPAIPVIIFLLVSINLLILFSFLISYAIATYFKKFGPTYAITMTIYFLTLILSGSMGMSVDKLPGVIKTFSDILPMKFLVSDAHIYWNGLTDYNLVPLIQSLFIYGLISIILVFLVLKKEQRQ